MTRPMDTESIITQMEQDTRDTGSRINNTVMEKKFGQTMPVIKDSIETVRSTEKVNSFGLTDPLTREISLKITFMVWVSILGLMVDATMVSGNKTRWMAMEFSPGVMEESTRDNM